MADSPDPFLRTALELAHSKCPRCRGQTFTTGDPRRPCEVCTALVDVIMMSREETWTLAHTPAKCGHARANWKDPAYGTPDYQGNEKCECCALLRQQDATHREALACAMNDCSLATGHGDTHADLLMELVWQVIELRGKVVSERTRVLEEMTKILAVSIDISVARLLFANFKVALKASSEEEKPDAD